MQEILIKKHDSNEMSHFYVLEPSYTQDSNFLLSWTKNLICKINKISTSSLENSPDILIIDSPEDQKQYQIEEIQEIFKFTAFSAMNLKKKFLIVNHSHKLTQIHLNKLLKTLEEPPIEMHIFFLNSQRVSTIDTISSRAIKLKVLNQKPESNSALIDLWDQDLDFQEFANQFKNLNISSNKAFSDLLLLTSEKSLSLTDCKNIEKSLKALEDDYIYNNSSHNKAFRIYSLLKSLK
jgi:hypothetical protein